MSTDPVSGTNPYPDDALTRLSVDPEGHDLLEQIMASTPPVADRRRWLPAAAAASVVALVAGGVLVGRAVTGDSASPSSSTSSSTSSTDPTQAVTPSATSAASPTVVVDPGLAPRSANLEQVVLRAPGWRVGNVAISDDTAGSITWTNGTDRLEMNWYAAQFHPAYLADRRRIGNARDLELLGQHGASFAERYRLQGGDGLADGNLLEGRSASPTAPGEYRSSPSELPSLLDDPTSTPNGPWVTRVMATFPPVGASFLELDGTMADRDEFEALVSQLTRVTEQEWLAALDRATVVPDEARAFLAESSRGVTTPPGLTVTVADLRLPQSEYHARVAYIAKVACAWAGRYVAGDEAALSSLQGASDWPVLQAIADEGGYAEAVTDGVRELAKDRSHPYAQGWGCAAG